MVICKVVLCRDVPTSHCVFQPSEGDGGSFTITPYIEGGTGVDSNQDPKGVPGKRGTYADKEVFM